MNDIKFTKTNGGMGRKAASEDPVSGLIFDAFVSSGSSVLTFGTAAGNLKGFETVVTDHIRKFNFVEQLDDAGIVWTENGNGSGTGGALTDSEKAKNALHYHISEFFRMNPQGTLYVMIKGDTDDFDEADLSTLQNYANGAIRQCGVFSSTLPTIADVQGELADLEANHKPMSVVLTYDGSSVTTLSSLADLSAAGKCNVSVLVGCDGDATLAGNLGDYANYGCIGLCIGAISKAAVNECIAWVQKFPLGLKAPALFNGNLIKNIAQGDLETLNTNRYIFVITHVGDANNYFNDSHTCDVATSDYAFIENVRTIDKACRGVRANLLPYLNSPLKVDAETGKLDSPMVAFLETTAGKALEEMEAAGELSGYRVEIDPEQNVISTSQLEIIIKNVPTGVMRKVNVKIGFTTALN